MLSTLPSVWKNAYLPLECNILTYSVVYKGLNNFLHSSDEIIRERCDPQSSIKDTPSTVAFDHSSISRRKNSCSLFSNFNTELSLVAGPTRMFQFPSKITFVQMVGFLLLQERIYQYFGRWLQHGQNSFL